MTDSTISNSTTLKWHGPFSFLPNGGNDWFYKNSDAGKAGLYLWTVAVNNEYWVNYIGMSNDSVAKRLTGHLQSFLSGKYWIYEAEDLRQGKFSGMYNPGKEDALSYFLKKYGELSNAAMPHLCCYKLFVAPVSGSTELLQRIESELILKVREMEATKDPDKNKWFLNNKRISRHKKEGDSPITVQIDSNGHHFRWFPFKVDV